MLLIIGFNVISEEMHFPGFWACIPVIGTALILISQNSILSKSVLNNSIIVWFGLISYPLYLWHWPIIKLFEYIFPGVSFGSLSAYVLFLVISLSWATWKFIEMPVRYGGRLYFSIQVKAFAMLLIMTSLVCFAISIKIKNGFPSRNPEAINKYIAIDRYKMKSYMRFGKCMLDIEFDKESFSNTCIETLRPMIFIWGDSHAASLYPGLADLQKTHYFGIAQYTSAGCTPILDFEDKVQRIHCKSINEAIFKNIQNIKPEFILLHSSWLQAELEHSLEKLPGTINLLKNIGIKKIILIGPVPTWDGGLPMAILNYYKNYSPHSLIPERSKYRLNYEAYRLDQLMKKSAKLWGVDYISVWELLCNEDGCLTRIEPEAGEPSYWDGAHITPSTSRFLANKMSDSIFRTKK